MSQKTKVNLNETTFTSQSRASCGYTLEGHTILRSPRSTREIIELHPALASDFDHAASFELKRLAQRALGMFGHLYSASTAVCFHSRSSIHGVTPNVIEQLASADHACHRRAGMNSDSYGNV